MLVVLISMSCHMPGFLSQELVETESGSDEMEPSLDLPEAEETLAMYLDAVVKDDLGTAVSLVSEYSLAVTGISQPEVRHDLAEWALLEYQILESRWLDDGTAPVRVSVKSQPKRVKLPAVSESWVALRVEGEEWRVNIYDLIDERELDVPAQTIHNVKVHPVRMIRFTDRIVLILEISNENTSRRCMWGGPKLGDTATFRFGNEVSTSHGELEFWPSQTYPDVGLGVKGLHESYPTELVLTKWRCDTDTLPSTAVPDDEHWSYHFTLEYKQEE